MVRWKRLTYNQRLGRTAKPIYRPTVTATVAAAAVTGLVVLFVMYLSGCGEAPVTAPARVMVSQRMTLPVVPWGEPCAPPVGEPIVWVDPCPGQVTCALPDLDNDGQVGINDFLLLLQLWGPSDCTLYRRGDINWDGEVDTADMLIILGVWDTYESATWDRCDC